MEPLAKGQEPHHRATTLAISDFNWNRERDYLSATFEGLTLAYI